MSRILVLMLLAFSFIYTFSTIAEAQVPNGVTDRVSSQMMYPYDVDTTSVGSDGVTNDRNTFVQVTNTSATQGVWIHVQILRSSAPGVVCQESNFVDFLTARDTHAYNMSLIRRNEVGGSPPSLLPSDPGIDAAVAGTKGFVFISPVVSATDRTAISFQHLIGNAVIFDNARIWNYRVNALGRDAINLGSGAILPDGTTLDGVATGFQTILPSQFSFEITIQTPPTVADVVIISFDDTYGAGGFDGYEPRAGSSTIDPNIVGALEDVISCADFALGCYHDLGINNDAISFANGLINTTLVPGDTPPVNLCGGENPLTPLTIVPFTGLVGWVFTPVTTASQNVVSFFGQGYFDSAAEGGGVWTRAE